MYKVLTVSDAVLLLPVTDDVEYSPSNRTANNTRQATIAIDLQAILSLVLRVAWIIPNINCPNVFIFTRSFEWGGAFRISRQPCEYTVSCIYVNYAKRTNSRFPVGISERTVVLSI